MPEPVRLLLRAARNASFLPLYWLGRLIPRRADLWAFGAWHGRRYADNSRYAFEFVSRHIPDVRAVWITREPAIVAQVRAAGGHAYLAYSPAGVWVCLRASLVVLTAALRDVNQVAAHGATVLQLWHGIPLKKIGWDDRITAHPQESRGRALLKTLWRALFPFIREPCHTIISPSHFISPRFVSSFALPEERVVVTGYPRADAILAAEPEDVPALDRARERTGATHVLAYIPTHRGEGRGLDFDLFDGLDPDALQHRLQAANALLCVKMHFYHEDNPPAALLELTRAIDSRVVWFKGEDRVDVNQLLPHVDTLITDYSSVFFDYMLLDRPMIFAPFDLSDYESTERQLYEDYDTATPGPKCTSWDAVLDEMDRLFAGQDPWAAIRQQKRKQYHRYLDTGNSARVAQLARRLTMRAAPTGQRAT